MKVQLLDGQSVLPQRAHEDDAGLDLSSRIDVTLQPGERALVPTGVAIELPRGHAGLVCPRSGLAARHGIGVVNGPGVVDAGYRGEIKVALINHDRSEPFTIATGDRIAQLLVVPVVIEPIEQVEELSLTVRSAAGFGSSGGFGASA